MASDARAEERSGALVTCTHRAFSSKWAPTIRAAGIYCVQCEGDRLAALDRADRMRPTPAKFANSQSLSVREKVALRKKKASIAEAKADPDRRRSYTPKKSFADDLAELLPKIKELPPARREELLNIIRDFVTVDA